MARGKSRGRRRTVALGSIACVAVLLTLVVLLACSNPSTPLEVAAHESITFRCGFAFEVPSGWSGTWFRRDERSPAGQWNLMEGETERVELTLESPDVTADLLVACFDDAEPIRTLEQAFLSTPGTAVLSAAMTQGIDTEHTRLYSVPREGASPLVVAFVDLESCSLLVEVDSAASQEDIGWAASVIESVLCSPD